MISSQEALEITLKNLYNEIDETIRIRAENASFNCTVEIPNETLRIEVINTLKQKGFEIEESNNYITISW